MADGGNRGWLARGQTCGRCCPQAGGAVGVDGAAGVWVGRRDPLGDTGGVIGIANCGPSKKETSTRTDSRGKARPNRRAATLPRRIPVKSSSRLAPVSFGRQRVRMRGCLPLEESLRIPEPCAGAGISVSGRIPRFATGRLCSTPCPSIQDTPMPRRMVLG